MKKKALTLSTIVLILVFSSLFAFASANKLTYGLDVIAYDMEIAKTGPAGSEISFTAKDFENALGVSKIASITVLTLPEKESGELRLSGVPVMKNQIISRDSIEKLTFVPALENGFETSFVIGSVSTSQPLAVKCKITIANADGSAPEAFAPDESEMTEAIEGVVCYSYLTNGDGTNAKKEDTRYRIVSYPENGTLRLLDNADGYYCYTPVDGFTGSDVFTYVVTDKYGKNPKQSTVEIKVRSCLSDIEYFDMKGNTAHQAAMILAEKGIMAGETVCGVSYFEPEGGVRRDEFLAMVIKAAGIDVPYDSKAETTFADDSSIPDHLKSYVAYAEKEGYVNGVQGSMGNVFIPAGKITTAEAALMIYNVVGMEPSGESEVFADSAAIPDWAKEALASTANAGIIDTGSYSGYASTVTRAQAAQMLVKVIELCEQK